MRSRYAIHVVAMSEVLPRAVASAGHHHSGPVGPVMRVGLSMGNIRSTESGAVLMLIRPVVGCVSEPKRLSVARKVLRMLRASGMPGLRRRSGGLPLRSKTPFELLS